MIGVGYLGRFHAQKYAALAGSRLVAVVDADPSARESVAAETGCRPVADYRDIFGEVDAVSIATPTPAHHRIARECLERGVHVLVEKPVTETIEEARDLMAAAARAGACCRSATSNDSTLRSGRSRARSGRRASSRVPPAGAVPRARYTDVNVVLDLMIHDIDLIQSPCARRSCPSTRSGPRCSRRGWTSPTRGSAMRTAA